MSDAPSAPSASPADAAPSPAVPAAGSPASTPAPAGIPGAAADFDAIYREHSRAIFYLALRMLGDPQRAEDAETVARPEDIDDELRHLLAVLSA